MEQYDGAISNLSLWRDPSPLIDRALEDDEDFLLGHAFRTYMNLLPSDRDLLGSARQSLARVREIVEKNDGLTGREALHVDALEEWALGNMKVAGQILDQLLDEYPTDMLAIWMGHQLDFYLGDSHNLCSRIDRIMPNWDKSHRLYGFLLGMHSFGLEESGNYKAAEDVGRESVTLNPQDVWGIHAVAHSLEMQGEFDSGATYMGEHFEHWSKGNFFYPHNALHAALFRLEQNDVDGVLALYDSYIQADITRTADDPVILTLVDASSALWRLYLEGEDVGDRWHTLAAIWERKAYQAFYTFNDMHAMMAFVASGNGAAATRLIETLEHYLADDTDRTTTNFAITRDVGLPICRAIRAFGRCDYTEVVDELFPIRERVHHFGGSHAQRDIVARTLLEASLRAGNRELARKLLRERLRERPKSSYNLRKQKELDAAH